MKEGSLSGQQSKPSDLNSHKNEIMVDNGSENISTRSKVVTSLLAGAVAGGLAKTTIAPLDRTKINFQIKNIPFSFYEAYRFIVISYQESGLTSLWRGNSATMARVLPYAAIQYSTHEQFKRLLEVETNEQKKIHPHRSFIAGSLAGVVSTSVTYPLDFARARMAVTHREKYNSLVAVFVQTIQKEGVGAIYKGYLPTVLGVIPYAGTSFFTYETLKRLHNDYYGPSDPHPLERLVFGALAGLFGQSASYPLDIVRRRMQTQPGQMTIFGVLYKVSTEEGIFHGLYKGLSLNWVKGPIAVGISFTTFDLVSKFLRELSIFTDL